MTKPIKNETTEPMVNADPKLQPGQPDIAKTRKPLDDDEDDDFDESLDDIDYDNLDYEDDDDY